MTTNTANMSASAMTGFISTRTPLRTDDWKPVGRSVFAWIIRYSLLTLLPLLVVAAHGFEIPASPVGALLSWGLAFVALLFFGRAIEIFGELDHAAPLAFSDSHTYAVAIMRMLTTFMFSVFSLLLLSISIGS